MQNLKLFKTVREDYDSDSFEKNITNVFYGVYFDNSDDPTAIRFESDSVDEAVDFAKGYLEKDPVVCRMYEDADEDGNIQGVTWDTNVWYYEDGEEYDLRDYIDELDEFDADDLVEMLEENEDMVECKECFELFPKVSGIRISKGYICPCCCDKPKQPDFDVDSISDSDIFKVDFPEYDKFEDDDDIFAETEFPTEEDEFDPIMPNTFSELVDALIKDEFDAIDQYEDAKVKVNELPNLSQEDIDNLTKVVDHIVEEEKEHVEELQAVITKEVNVDENDPISDEEDKIVSEDEILVESQAQEIGQTYKNLSKKFGFDVEDLVYGKDGFMNTKYPEGFPDFAGDVIYSEKYWNELVDFAKEKGLKLTEYYQRETIESDQKLDGTDNAVVDCKVADVITHSEDEKSVDCKGEKKPLSKPLTEKLSAKFEDLKAEIDRKSPEPVVIDGGYLPYDFGYETSWYEDVAIEVSREENGEYVVWSYLETENGPVSDPEEQFESESFEEVAKFLVDKKILSWPITEATHATMAKPEGDRAKAFNNALRYAKKNNVDYIYGYTNHTGKFFALDQPVKAADENAEKAFRNQYKNCKTVYRVYPDKSFIKEDLATDEMTAVEDYLRQANTELEAEWIESDGIYTDELRAVVSYNPRLNKFILDIYNYHSSEDNNAEVGPDGHLTDMDSYKFDSLEEVCRCFPDEMKKIFDWNDYKLILK